jgi:cell wall-associated NlpC family hydrolase
MTAILAACGSADNKSEPAPTPLEDAAQCETVVEAPELLPGVDAHHLTLDFWLNHLAERHDMDEILLSPDEIAALNAGIAVPREKYHAQRDLLEPLDMDELVRQVQDRRTWARDGLAAGTYLHADGSTFTQAELAPLDQDVSLAGVRPELRVAVDSVPIRCAPMPDSFFSEALDLRLDRNACSTLAPQQVIRVIAEWPSGMKLAQTRYSFGWIAPGAALSPPIPDALQEAFVRGVRLQVATEELVVSTGGGTLALARGTRVPAADKQGTRAHVATASDFVQTTRVQPGSFASTRRPLTRRALLEEAWRYLGGPYGLGDTDGGRDCSRLVLDVFEAFDIRLPRHSSWQARAGSFWIDVSQVPETERALLIDTAAQKGIVLLSFPGHIMLYLGRNERGEPMVLHAFREYLEPCTGGQDTLFRVDGVTVSNLELGRGTERTAFIERVTHITVLGAPPGIELAGAAQLRPASEALIPSDRQCRDSTSATIQVSPDKPARNQPVRVIAALSQDPGPAAFTLIDPEGNRHTPRSVRLGGPPFGFVATIDSAQAGRWKAVLADGERVIACQRFWVTGQPIKPLEPNDGPIWWPTRQWSVATENLYALFVERLFDYPFEEELVWRNLHTLLRDRERNILYNHFGRDEDERIDLVPDCADLPYTLRAYFAWKMGLPFGYRRCSRARGGKPPLCDQPGGHSDNLMSRLELKGARGVMVPRDDIEAFSIFVNNNVRNAVHSSSGRTHPEDDLTDFYPVPLTREALKPGTLFADPYGHLLVVADWIPQGADSYGVLVGVDAQPDGTVGRRRFWRGSFLFDPDYKPGGAGFKAFRPHEFNGSPVEVMVPLNDEDSAPVQRVGFMTTPLNEDLRKSRKYTRFSMEQYQGTTDDFYAAVEALINPRPLDPEAMQSSLVDALYEAVVRRIVSVDNGEKFMAERRHAPIVMPDGAAIFLTSGPWEDFSTPSRDLRLLVAIDSVMLFAQRVAQAPERYGLRPDQVDAEVAELGRVLARELAKHSFTYTRSDGSPITLTLADVIDRRERLEVAYNPNDCVEIRWAAPPDSNEMSTCKRRAPPEQQGRMERLRAWFSTRKRPPQ